MLLALFETQTLEQHFQHAAKQLYIGLGYGTIEAANEQIDSTPMDGFNPDNLDELMQLKKQGLRSTVMLDLEYRNAETVCMVILKN